MSHQSTSSAKPFLKWAGGKSQLIEKIAAYLPQDLKNGTIVRYIEPLVGGGAVLFYILQNYHVEQAIINDINPALIALYQVIKRDVHSLIEALAGYTDHYLSRNDFERKEYFYEVRKEHNLWKNKINFNTLSGELVNYCAQTIFLNKTCFNGLYRVNQEGYFNVPPGRYKNPKILDASNLIAVSKLLQGVTLMQGEYINIYSYADDKTFIYLDPPYRPISKSANFTSYSAFEFDERQQIRLSEFYRKLHNTGAKLMLSNSEPKNINPDDNFFEIHYQDFNINKVRASRVINSKASARGEIFELLITNYEH